MSDEESDDAIRRTVRAWLANNWDPDRALLAWRELLVDSGWAVPSWPQRWHGRGLPAWADGIVADEIRRAGAVGPPLGSGMSLAAPTMLAHGSDDLRERLLRPTITGAVTWCQLFSEPGAGSDLAGLSTSAIADGDEWVINGQKVWTTSAHHADFGMLLARTDRSVPKHAGITYLVLPMKQPGVEVRPILQMNGHSSFNEVFLTDARVPAANIVGALGDGWRVARTTLMHERTFATLRRPAFPAAGGLALEQAAAESARHFATYAWYPQRAGRADLVAGEAEHHGVDHDPLVRQQIAALQAFRNAHEWTAERARAARQLGRPPGPEGSLGKLAASEVARRSARAHTLIAGAAAMLSASPEAESDGNAAIVAEVLVSTPAQSIAGGTDEIQHNIIAENVLGLPREPDNSRVLPYKDAPRN